MHLKYAVFKGLTYFCVLVKSPGQALEICLRIQKNSSLQPVFSGKNGLIDANVNLCMDNF